MAEPAGVRFRWVVVAMLAAAAVLNYIDRQTLALMAGAVQGDLRIDDRGYAFVVNAFLVAYMIGGPLAAWIIDRVGSRWSMVLFVGWWSAACTATGFVGSTGQLAASRFALGLGEAGNWIVSPRLVREWFPERERALAIGLYSSAAHVGGTIAPIVIAAMSLLAGWRWTFAVSGAIGIVWVVVWLAVYRNRQPIPAYVGHGEAEKVVGEREEPIDRGHWRDVLRTRGVWGVAIGNALTNPVWFFYLFWFPKYLTEARGLSVAELGRLGWIVYAGAGVGAIAGGIVSGALVKRGMRAARARVVTMAMVAVIAPVGALNAFDPSIGVSLALGCLVAFCHTAWVTNQTALPVDLYPTRHVSKVMAINGLVGGIATIGTTWLIGELISTLTYRPMFFVIAIAYPLGLVAAYVAQTGRSMADREAA